MKARGLHERRAFSYSGVTSAYKGGFSFQRVGGTSRSLFLAASAAPPSTSPNAIGLTSHVDKIFRLPIRRTHGAIRIIIVAARERCCFRIISHCHETRPPRVSRTQSDFTKAVSAFDPSNASATSHTPRWCFTGVQHAAGNNLAQSGKRVLYPHLLIGNIAVCHHVGLRAMGLGSCETSYN